MQNVSRPVIAGVVAALVGFTSSFAVVLAGLRAVGASPAQAASGLLVLSLTQAAGILWLTLRHRTPLVLAWSTPGAAMLATTGVVTGGWPAAVGAFLIVGLLIVVTGLWPRLGRLIARIPTPLAQAMLAGVVLSLCLTPVRGLATHPWLVAPVLIGWLLATRFVPRWAVPIAFAITLAVIGIGAGGSLSAATVAPTLSWTAPAFSWAALLSIAVPLFLVTMASQNVPGTAVITSYGYPVPWRESMTVTGLGTLAGATFGGHAVNLAAITAAMTANPYVHPDPDRRWVAAHAAGWSYLVLAILSAPLTAFVSQAPAEVIGSVAGLALLGTLAASLHGALNPSESRVAVTITFVVAASGTVIAGIGSAFWALLAGLVGGAILTRRRAGRTGD